MNLTQFMLGHGNFGKSKKYFFKTKELIAINAYLLQIYLSMHRIGRASYPEFVDYYQNNVMPDKVLEYVNRYRNVTIPQAIQPLLDNVIQVYGEGFRCLSVVFKNWVVRKAQGGCYLSGEEVQCILFFLNAFSKLLQNKEAPVPPCDYLHSRIANFCSYCLEPKLYKWSKVDCVEHFMQTPSLNCLSIAVIVGDENWYK
jgi:hypothetical protein